MTKLPRTRPEEQGVSSYAISSFLDAVERQSLELHSFMLLRHGQVIAEGWWHPYDAETVHLLYSLSKSFTATAVGMAVEEGLVSVEDKVISFFPDEIPEDAGEHLKAMQVRHLLSMATGHTTDTIEHVMRTGDWVKNFLAIPPNQAPGTIFCYNNGATFMLSAILFKLTGMSLLEYLRPRLLRPLGIGKARWQENPQGIQLGFTGLHITTEAIAKFGQLYLQKGNWQGRQLVSEAWIEEATRVHIPSASPGQEEDKFDWQQGYGFQFWMCRHGAYRGDGAFGQFCVVMPEQDAVFVTTSGEDDMQAILDAAWKHLLPAVRKSTSTPDSEAQKDLKDKLSKLSYAPVQGEVSTATEGSLCGQRYDFEPVHLAPESVRSFGPLMPQSIRLDKLGLEQNEHWLVTLTHPETVELKIGYHEWATYSTGYGGDSERVVSSGAWTAADTFCFQLRYVETPHCLSFKLQFTDHEVKLDMSLNVAFGPLNAPQLTGKRVAS